MIAPLTTDKTIFSGILEALVWYLLMPNKAKTCGMTEICEAPLRSPQGSMCY
jgi:hypothetical protein